METYALLRKLLLCCGAALLVSGTSYAAQSSPTIEPEKESPNKMEKKGENRGRGWRKQGEQGRNGGPRKRGPWMRYRAMSQEELTKSIEAINDKDIRAALTELAGIAKHDEVKEIRAVMHNILMSTKPERKKMVTTGEDQKGVNVRSDAKQKRVKSESRGRGGKGRGYKGKRNDQDSK